MHKIEYVCLNLKTHTYKFLIDNRTIELTYFRVNNCCPTFSVSSLDFILREIEFNIFFRQSLSKVTNQIGIPNTFRLIELLCFKEFKKYWNDELNYYLKKSYKSFPKIFKKVFGMQFQSIYSNTALVTEIKKAFETKKEEMQAIISGKQENQIAQKEEKNSKIIKGSGFAIKYLRHELNSFSYSVNGVEVRICASRRAKVLSEKFVLQTIISLKQAYLNFDVNGLSEITKVVGFCFILRVSQLFFVGECCAFFRDLAQSYTTNRKIIYPSPIVKKYLGPKEENELYCQIISLLENEMILQGERLLAENAKEVLKSENWKLFYRNNVGNTYICEVSISFVGSTQLKKEQRAFLRQKEKELNKNAIKRMFRYNNSFKKCIRVLESQYNRVLTSILDLTIVDVIGLLSFFNQNQINKAKDTRETLLIFKRLYDFTAESTGRPWLVDPFCGLEKHMCFIHEEVHVIPASERVLEGIHLNIKKLDEMIQLAFSIAVITGARASSICEMTTESVMRSNDEFYLKICSYKTARKQIEAGKNPYVIHKIPVELGERLQMFISKTKLLREKLDVPYVFVYEKKLQRADSLRKPLVLRSANYQYHINKLLSDICIYDENGFPAKCTFSMIRAEVGRHMFATGLSSESVSRKLGNTPAVAQRHYHNLYPIDEARLYNELYEATIVAHLQQTISEKDNAFGIRREVFGDCSLPSKKCGNSDCRTCDQRVINEQKKNSE